MKTLLVLTLAVLSGLYLLVMGPTLDPLPFLDEGLAGLIFLNALAYLGVDLRTVFGRREPVPVPVREVTPRARRR
jgi:hypothetical protein